MTNVSEVEHASFTPLIFSCTGGLGPQATTSYKRLASLLSAKSNQAYSLTIMWLRCRLAYSLLRSSVMCIRGARSHLGHYMSATQPPLDLVSREALLLAQQTHIHCTSFPLSFYVNLSAALVAENRKHKYNDRKCEELGWVCIPLVVESYGWGCCSSGGLF